MFEYKEILGFASVLVAFGSYVIYFKQIFSSRVKPHAFSWFIWTLTTGIVFAAQIISRGGAGAWVTGFTSLACFAIFVLALSKGDRKFLISDWVFFISALLAILFWWVTKNPLLSVILLTASDAVAAFMTACKAYFRPLEESISYFGLSSIKFFLAIFALEAYSLTTWLYPGSLIITNGLIALLLFIRRKQISLGV